MKTNFKISQFSRFLLRSGYTIEVKILKWPKILNSVPFIKKTLVNHVFILKIFSKVRVCDLCQKWNWLKLLNSVPFIKRKLVKHIYIPIWSFWLSFTVLHWMKRNFKISFFEDFCWGPCMRFWSKFEKD